MRRAGLLKSGLAIILWLAFTGCYRNPVDSPGYGQIILSASFDNAHRVLQKSAAAAGINRVLVTVWRFEYNIGQQPLIGDIVLRQPLAIVSGPQGRFAEGSISVPLQKEVNQFEVAVDAFDNLQLAYSGSGFVSFTKGDDNPVVLNVTLRPVQ